MGNYIAQITECIERTFDLGGKDYSKKIIVFPCGDIGIQIINIMRTIYSLEPAYMIDNHKCKYSPVIQDSAILEDIDNDEYVIILATIKPKLYELLKKEVSVYITAEKILGLECVEGKSEFRTKCGKYSYGSLCQHKLVESVGAFCSFAVGVDVVNNHAMEYLTTSPFVYYDAIAPAYEENYCEPWYFEGVRPKGKRRTTRSKIGSDVWLGKNVIITNGATIGNGVIAGAGAVITKDVPDYAVVGGAPARIIRYRYTQEQIQALNRIAWWDWTDDEIRERFDDFYLPIEEFIEKYDR